MTEISALDANSALTAIIKALETNATMKASTKSEWAKDLTQVKALIQRLDKERFKLECQLATAKRDNDLVKEIRQLKDELKSTPPQSYAKATLQNCDALNIRSTPQTNTTKNDEMKGIILTVSTVNNGDLKDTLKKLRTVTTTIKPIQTWQVKSGAVRLKMRSYTDAKTVRNELEKAGLKARLPKKFLPRLKIFDVPTEFEESEVASRLGITEPVLINVEKGKRNESKNIIFSVKPSTFAQWRGRKLNLATFIDCKMTESLDVQQCGHCLGLGHSSKKCPIKAADKECKCAHCGGDGHRQNDCPSKTGENATEPTCTLCKHENRTDTGHNAYSDNCPVRQHFLRTRLDHTIYDDDQL